MKYWPVPDSPSKKFPEKGSPGSFWEDRGDRFHCGVDIHAEKGSKVLSIESGIVMESGVFTDPEVESYWNKTYFVIIKSFEYVNYKYAELNDIFVHTGDYVEAGDEIGIVGDAINTDKVHTNLPFYIRELVDNQHDTMLHLELLKAPITHVQPYSGGNYFGAKRPQSLIDPAEFLREITSG